MGEAAVPECGAAANSLSGPRAARRFVAAKGLVHDHAGDVLVLVAELVRARRTLRQAADVADAQHRLAVSVPEGRCAGDDGRPLLPAPFVVIWGRRLGGPKLVQCRGPGLRVQPRPKRPLRTWPPSPEPLAGCRLERDGPEVHRRATRSTRRSLVAQRRWILVLASVPGVDRASATEHHTGGCADLVGIRIGGDGRLTPAARARGRTSGLPRVRAPCARRTGRSRTPQALRARAAHPDATRPAR